ncbi:MAG: hypothetical protein ABIQ30_05315 [Devosia sp.]
MISATIVVDGKEFTASNIWRLTLTTEHALYPPISYRKVAEGEALVFDIGDGKQLFLAVDSYPLMGCAMRAIAGEAKDPDLPAALAALKGTCDIDPMGRFIQTTASGSDIPRFTNIGWSHQAPFADYGITFKSLSATMTEEAPRAEMIQRFPWISVLQRTDCGQGCYHWQAGLVYANDFTSSLPPLDCPPLTGNRLADDKAQKGTPCDPFRKVPDDAIRYERGEP